MEMFDLIDKNDQVVGQVSREDAHNDARYIHRAVHFTLIDPISQKVMITRRAYTKKHDGGILCVLGEHVQSGENYEQAVRRGALEELKIEADQVVEVGEHTFAGDNFTERVKMYLVVCDENIELHPDSAEIAEIAWYTKEQLGSLVVSEMTKYWLDHIHWESVRMIQPTDK